MINPFEKSAEEQIELVNTTSLLVQIDDFEENIKLIDKLNKQYDELKSKIKEEMLKVGKNNNLEQVKWTTPKGIKITCSIGKKAEYKKVLNKEFSLEKLMKEFPDVYEKCLVEQERNECVVKASNDRLVITTPKEA